jgi:tetratricopeptide (TPR) repeat protein/predicted Ser/Thr protein kinase
MNIEPGKTLSHYRLIEKIGEGGMGVVWKAEDLVLGRTVAIKFLLPGAVRDEPRRQMFLSEARLASSVSEASIVQVHEFGHEEDQDFIVMEYVEGKPLNRILHGRPLPPEKVASMGHQVAHALSRAHRKGLLHRDLKPANLLVTSDGDVKVVDFGLAILSARGAAPVGAEDPTRVGEDEPVAVTGPAPPAGTLAYMSPEQARSENLDARSDIFSLGSVLYEMTTGQRPFMGATRADLLQEILRARPIAAHDLVPKVPLDLDRILQKALAPKPGDRYQTMEDLAVDLKRLGQDLDSGSSPSYEDLKAAPASRRRLGARAWILSGVLLLAAAAAAAAAWLAGWRPGAREDAGTVLILPLEVRGQTDGAEYVGRAFAETIAANLLRVEGLGVLPVPEAGELGQGGTLDRSRRALAAGAGRMLTGALTISGDTVHATLNLVDTRRNHLISGFNREIGGRSFTPLAIALAGEVATALGGRPPKSYEYFLYLTGTPAMAASPDFGAALGALRRLDAPVALAATRRLLDAFPNEPDAHVLRATAVFYEADDHGVAGSPIWKTYDETLSALERIDPRSPWLSFFQAYSIARRGQIKEALVRFAHILERDDLTPGARAYLMSIRSYWLVMEGRKEDALADVEETIRLNPTDDRNLGIVSATLLELGRLDEAAIRAGQAVALNPASGQNNNLLGECLYRLGKWEEAIVPLASACALRPIQWYCADQALALWHAGRRIEARAAANLAASQPETAEGAHALARYQLMEGNRVEALSFLRRHLEINPGFSPSDADKMNLDPDFSALHADAEFQRIVGEVRKRGL